MCGIAGVWGRDALARTKTMLPPLYHRGPDGEGLWSNGNLAIGHRRLAINDLSESGIQPMVSLDGNVVIGVNGEIYNYVELRRELESYGCVFQSACDSEVVLHAWSIWAEACFIRFNGMFAISIYDQRKNCLILARDRLGIKPLYYHQPSKNELLFSSEVKSLKAGVQNQKFGIDPVGLAQFLTYQNYFDQRTLSADVLMLSPGAILIFSDQGFLVKPYWSLKHRYRNDLSFDDAVEEYKHTLDAAIERHLMSDVPVASYLSAGFDSASVADRASVLGEPPVSFTGAFAEGEWYDESSIASDLAAKNGSKHVVVPIGWADVPRVFDRLIFALDEPRMGMGALPQYCVAEQVAKTHKVVLTGHGGDELFSGYPVFKLIHALYGSKRKKNGFLGGLSKIERSELPHLVYFFLSQYRSNRYRQFLPVLNGSRSLRLGLRAEFASAVCDIAPEEELLKSGFEGESIEDKLYRHYLQTYLNGLLVVEDKISMAHSLESRTPLLDNELLQLSLSMPASVKLNGGVLKAVVKKAGLGRLPRVLYSQPKRGFPTPLRFWLRGPLSEWFSQRIIGEDSALKLMFEEKWLRATYNNYIGSYIQKVRPLDEIQSHRMWQLLSLESWLRQNVV
ncbi:MAG: asparagine synthase (glutamine-hydrolyzing) [Pseudomonadales bacterium]